MPWGTDTWLLNRSEEAQEALPLELIGSSLTLFVEQQIRVVDDEEADGGKKCQTLSYRYRLQDVSGSPLIRWEYDREVPREDYRYPLAHVHVHAQLAAGDQRDLEQLHIATGRVPLELVIRHLITDWGVRTKDDQWPEILNESLVGFYERRTRY